jgi:uncharacterized membrane protein
MLNLAELALLAVAAYRATQLVVHDTVLDPARDRLMAWQQNRDSSHIRMALVTLSACTYCAGWWMSGAALAAYLTGTGTWRTTSFTVHALEWFAVAGGQALLNRLDDTMGSNG